MKPIHLFTSQNVKAQKIITRFLYRIGIKEDQPSPKQMSAQTHRVHEILEKINH